MNFKPEDFPIKLKRVHIETTSQLIRFGHWFTFFNMMIVILIGSRYFFLADWPPTLPGRFYAIISCVGHFGFLTFLSYLFFIFPFSFILHSIKWQQIIAIFVSTIGITLLLMDLTAFSMFKIHLNFDILDLLISRETGELFQHFQRIFIFVPAILAFEMFLAVWIWKKIRSLTKRKKYARPFIIFWLTCFFSFHLFHIWADVTFYRPIIMQHQSLPYYSPLTARDFLIRSGFLNEQRFEAEKNKNLDESITSFNSKQIEYPLEHIELKDETQNFNLLLINIHNWRGKLEDYPKISNFGREHSQFNLHYGASTDSKLAEFSLLYGLDPNYYSAFIHDDRQSILTKTLAMRNYHQESFMEKYYNPQTNLNLINRFLKQLDQLKASGDNKPWFIDLNFAITEKTNLLKFDKDLGYLIEQLKQDKIFKNTVIILVGLNSNNSHSKSLVNRANLKVPLLIAVPDKSSEIIDYATTHVDILATIMSDWLNVKTATKQFTTGNNLFKENLDRSIVVANLYELGVYYPKNTLIIKDQNNYFSYDSNGILKANNRFTTMQYLSFLSENRRFIINY